VYRILLIVIALIVYGSLYPWDFHASPLWVLIRSWPDHIDRFLFRDIAVNVVIYMPVGVFGLLALRQKFHTPFAVTVTVLLALGLSSSIEMTQLFDDARDCSAFDVVCNVSGTVLGVALGYVYQQWLQRFLARAETAKLLQTPGFSTSVH
jgi:glycopeptide antibiotics resistance protein